MAAIAINSGSLATTLIGAALIGLGAMVMDARDGAQVARDDHKIVQDDHEKVVKISTKLDDIVEIVSDTQHDVKEMRAETAKRGRPKDDRE